MKLTVKRKGYSPKPADAIAVLVSEKNPGDAEILFSGELSFINERCDPGFFKGKSGETAFFSLRGHPAVIIGGLGKEDDLNPESVRNAAGALAAECLKKGITAPHVYLPRLKRLGEADVLTAVAEGLLLGDYSFNRYKTKKDNGETHFDKLHFITDEKEASSLLRRTETVCDNTALCRDLVMECSDSSTPEAIAREAKKLTRFRGVQCRIFNEKEIAKMGMGLLTAVGRGAANPPRFVVLRYRGDAKSSKSIALVGKGITFDTGGINLKPSGSIETMRSDMAGAAATLYTIKAAAELGLKKNITAVLPLTENMMGSRAYKPGDVYRAYNGKTVEIGNTDAEGRLVLADALAYTVDKIKPDYIVDIATLTGACLIALGEITAGFLANDDTLADWIFKAGERTGERLWRLPLYREYADDIKSDIADMNNIAAGRKAGTIIGAIFLKNFVGKTPWAHIDIAGTSWYSKKRGYRPKYATGYGVRLFIDFLENLEL